MSWSFEMLTVAVLFTDFTATHLSKQLKNMKEVIEVRREYKALQQNNHIYCSMSYFF